MRINLFSLPLDAVTEEEAAARILRFLHEDGQRHVVTLNSEMVLEAQKHSSLKEIIRKADLVVPDGMGLVLAGRMLKHRFPERVTGIGLLERLAAALAFFEIRLFLLGGRIGAAEAAALFLNDRYPELSIGWLGEEFMVTDEGSLAKDSFDIWDRMKRELAQGPPTLLVAALGSPKQEFWIAGHLSELPSVRVAMGAGGAIDMLAGLTPRAPLPLRALGLEWFWRLLLEPRRIKRINRLAHAFPMLVLRAMRRKGEHELPL